MKSLIRSIPLPLSGVMLGFAALGNLLQSYSEAMRTACGIVSFLLLILLLLKLAMFFSDVKKDLSDPVLASVSAPFPMGLMLLSVYTKPFLGIAAAVIWYFAIVLHLALIVYFTVRFLFKLDLKKVFASYFIVYVGIAAASVTAPAYSAEALGEAIFWFAFVCFIALLLLIAYRYLKLRAISEPARPFFCIFAAPASLCLAGYIQSAAQKSPTFILIQAVLSLALYLMALVGLPKLLKLKFYPSYAAFTFPFVISAIAIKQAAAALSKLNVPVPAFATVATVQTAIAAGLVLYALIRYTMAIVKASKAASAQAVA